MFESKIQAYKQKLYRNAVLKGAILTIAAVLGLLLLFSFLEYLNNFSSITRTVLFGSYIIVFIYTLFVWVLKPIAKLNGISNQISDEIAAEEIGRHFPEISDKLLNSIQLQTEAGKNSLIKATLEQRNKQFNPINFTSAISYRDNLTYWYRYLLPALIILIGVLIIKPQVITESTPKIVQFDKEFLPIAPFSFNLLSSNLDIFKGDDFELKVELNGDAIPSDVYIETDKGSLIKLESTNPGYSFVHTFKKLQHPVKFRFKAAGYYSKEFRMNMLTRPSLSKFSVQVEYPRYTKKTNETITNTGNLLVPEGSNITWFFDTKTADSIRLYFKDITTTQVAENIDDNVFKFEYKSSNSTEYSVTLSNVYGTNKDSISYFLNVIKDQYPSISMRQYQDTVMFDYLVFGGNIGDDYGITRLRTRYRIKRKEENKAPTSFDKIDIPFNKKAIDQSFYYKLETNQFNLKEGDRLEYFVEVYDNDGVNGNKRSKTPLYTFQLPTSEEIEKDLEQTKAETKNQLEETLAKAEQLDRDLKKLEEKLKGKRQLTWQDKKDIQKLIEQRKALEKEIQSLQSQSQELKDKQDKFSDQQENTSQKSEQLQKIIDDINDEETKKLYEELNKLMEQNHINQSLQENLKNIEKKQKNLKHELERTIKLFKKLQMEQKANEVAKKLEDLAQEQQKLAKETKDLENKEEEATTETEEEKNRKEKEDLVKKQEDVNKKFENIKQQMDELRKMDKEEKTNQDFEQFTPNERSISKEQKNASEQLKQNQKKQAQQSQKKAANKMQQMAKAMQQSMQSAEMEQISEDHDALRQIMENLLKLSFDQENLMESFKEVRRIDPKFVELSQSQLKLRDDSKYIEDSLIALSKRVFQIESFVTREVTDMNKYMDESLDAIKRRVPEIAASKQQFSMTAINNLALLLSDILDNMQQQMSQSMAGQQMNQKQSSSQPSPSQMQQSLNQQMENLKKSGKSGKELSKELAKLAAQQEMIRNALKQSMGKGQEQMQGKDKNGGEEGDGEGEGGNPYKKILKEMEQTEDDLVNKKLTDKLIKRQKEILTRMLESEKAKKEKGQDEERKGETAKKQKIIPPPDSFDEYLKQKETQIELLRTIPTSLNTYYKQEVNKYFEKIKD